MLQSLSKDKYMQPCVFAGVSLWDYPTLSHISVHRHCAGLFTVLSIMDTVSHPGSTTLSVTYYIKCLIFCYILLEN